MEKYKNSKGVSLLFVIGSYGGFHYTKSEGSLHICIAFLAITLFFYDVENVFAKILLNKEEKCIIHSTDFNGKCFNCGEQVFVRET